MKRQTFYRALALPALALNASVAEAAPDSSSTSNEVGLANVNQDDRDSFLPSEEDVSHWKSCASCTASGRELSDGFDFSASLGFEAAANVGGGPRHRVADADQLTITATVDTEKVLDIAGGTLRATVTFRRGKELERVAGLQTLQQVQEVFGRDQTWRLTQLWYQQRLFNSVDVKFGRLTQGEDFGNFSCEFMNLTFCGMPAGNIAGDYWYNWPISQWGARIRISVRGVTAMAGIYENNPRNLENKFIIGRFHGATGVLIPVELAVTGAKGPSDLPGSFKVGAWYNSSNADDVGTPRRENLFEIEASPRRRSGRYGPDGHGQRSQFAGFASRCPAFRPMADSPPRDIPPFFGGLASVRHLSHRRVRQVSDTYAIWLTRQHTGFTTLFPASPCGLPHTVCSLKEIIPIPARPSRSAGITGIARSLADPWQPRPRRVPYGKMPEEHDNLDTWLAPLPRCHTIFPHHISHMTAAVWQVFYLALFSIAP